jgi:hypothetical protein
MSPKYQLVLLVGQIVPVGVQGRPRLLFSFAIASRNFALGTKMAFQMLKGDLPTVATFWQQRPPLTPCDRTR